MQEQIKS